MPVEGVVPETKGSFIRDARRAQLIDSAVEEIALVGYARASTVRIARRAGVSRGVLTYHFRDRAELIDAVVETVYALGAGAVRPVVDGSGSPRAALSAYLGASVDFYAAYPRHIAALGEIFTAGRHTGSPARAETAEHAGETTSVCELLREGQRAGQFRDFDVPMMAGVVRAALDVAAQHLAQGADVALVRAELVRTLDAATREETP